MYKNSKNLQYGDTIQVEIDQWGSRDDGLGDHSNGLSPNGLVNGESVDVPSSLLVLPLGGGLGGIAVIITREIELSRIILVISGLLYDSFDNIF